MSHTDNSKASVVVISNEEEEMVVALTPETFHCLPTQGNRSKCNWKRSNSMATEKCKMIISSNTDNEESEKKKTNKIESKFSISEIGVIIENHPKNNNSFDDLDDLNDDEISDFELE